TRWRTRSCAGFAPRHRCRVCRRRAIWRDRRRQALMRIRFWGTRGSLATPGPTTLRYGGNTSCVEARASDGTLIVLDCGTGGVRVVAQYLNHPALTLGYRLEADGAAVVYAVDHEPHMRDRPDGGGIASADATALHAEDARHVAFLEGADLVIHDAQYTASEY